jgi:hypothetical protein
LPATPKARARYKRAEERAVGFMRKDLKRLGLSRQFKVSDREIRR